jgi:hypothetical protein
MCSNFKSCCCLNTKLLHYHHRMHVENELVKFVTVRDQEYEETVEEYCKVQMARGGVNSLFKFSISFTK